MQGPEDSSIALDELEHQALDELDGLALGPAWAAAQAGSEQHRREFEAALDDAGVRHETVVEAVAIARSVVLRLSRAAAEQLLEAATVLEKTPDRGALDPAMLDLARATLTKNPELGPAIAAAVEGAGIMLGLDRRGVAWAVLVDLGDRVSVDAPHPMRICSAAIAERLVAAWPTVLAERSEASRALRVFRSAAMVAAGASVRARFLAADHPEHLAIARALVDQHRDPATLVEQFDAARASLEADAKPAASEPEAQTDGPKRKFTAMHLILALIILGLTVWHYGFR